MSKQGNELNVKEYSVLKNMMYCIRATMEHYPLLLLWCSLLVITNVLLPVLTLYLPKEVIEKITAGNRSDGEVWSLISIVAVFTISIAILMGIKKFMEQFIYYNKFKLNTYYQGKVASKGMTTDYSNQENENFRKLQSESFSSCNGHYSPVAQVYNTGVSLLSNAFGFVVYFGILMKLNIFVMLFVISSTLISYFLNKKVVKWAFNNNKEKIGYGQRTNYINRISGDIKSAKDIRLYNMSAWLENVYQKNYTGLSNWYKRYFSKTFKIAVVDGGLSLLRQGLVYAYLLYLVLNNRIIIADFVLYFAAITGFSIWLDGILGEINELNRISLAINYLRAFFDYPETFRRIGGIVSDTFQDMPKKIKLKNVSFRYEGACEDTLNNINLSIDPSEHLGIVGLNGAGKTTLMKLICGLCDPTEGVVLYDGVDVREYNRISFYKMFSAVFQQFSLLPVTIEEIVAETTIENVNIQKVEKCLHDAGLWEKINDLPKGVKSNYDKTIYDDGIELSGGEVQKLLLSRALYKNAPVIILDEPTAALDPISESRLYENYDLLMEKKTAIFISHRLASTRFCHRILLIDKGSITEEGTHESLLEQKGTYYSLFETQAKYYRDNPEVEDGQEVEI